MLHSTCIGGITMELQNKKELGLKMWLDGGSLTKVSSELGINRLTLTNYIKSKGYTITNPSKKYNYNETYFKIINTEHKAYWLGFLYADGSITELRKTLRLEISLSSIDKSHLLKFIEDIDGDLNMIKDHTSTLNGIEYAVSSLNVNCTNLCRDLISQGCTPRKSLTLKFPTTVPNHLLRHFIRGYFDGDGCVDTNRKRINVLGTNEFLTSLSSYFESLGVTPTKLYKKKDNKAYSMEKYGVNAKIILNHIYNPSTIYLDRKFNKAVAVLSSDT